MTALTSVFCTRRHLELALPHNLASELESEQIAKAHRQGEFPASSWPDEERTKALANLIQLRRTLINTCLIAVALAVVALALAISMSKIHPSLEPDYGKVAAWLGGAFGAWAALLQLSPVRQSWRGSMLHEVAYFAAVRYLAVLGILLAGFGALWWQ